MRWLSNAGGPSESGGEPAPWGRRAVRVQQLALVWEVLSALGVAASAGLYARYQAWQTLVVLGVAFLSALLCRISRRLSLAGRAAPAGALLLLVSVIAPGAATMLVTELGLLSSALALALPIGTAALVCPRSSFPAALYVGTAGAALCVLLNQVWPWGRLEVTGLSIYVFPMMALATAGVAALLWSLAGTPPGRSLRMRLLSSFLLVGAVPAVVAWIAVTTRHWPAQSRALPGVGQGGPGALASEPALRVWIASLGLCGVVFSVALAFRLAARIAAPFHTLARRAHEIDGGGTRALVSSGDEAEALAQVLDATQLREQGSERATGEGVSVQTGELEQRCRHAEAVAEVARVALSVLDVRHLCRAVVDVIRERFALRYVGLYTLQLGESWAELRADSVCPGWQAPSEPSHVRVGEGLTGRSIEQAELVVGDPGGAAEESDTVGVADGPAVRAALPLRSRGQALGAIVVHADHRQRLGKELLEALHMIGHLAALALDRARVLEESQEALAAAERAAGRLSLAAWAELVRARTDLGFRGNERGVERAKGTWHPRMLRAARGNVTVVGERALDDAGGQYLTVPIRAQGQVIGVLDMCKPEGDGVWTADQRALVEQIAEQLSHALENARLYEETQRRGVRERQLREIGTRIGSGVDLDAILQTAVEDVARALGVPVAFVQLYEGGPIDGPLAEQAADV